MNEFTTTTATTNTDNKEATMNEAANVLNDNAKEAVMSESEIKSRMVSDVESLFSEYDIDFDHFYIKQIVEDWWNAKAPLRDILRKSKAWNEEAQAVIFKEKTILRSFDEVGARKFRDWASETLEDKGKYYARSYFNDMYYWMEQSFKDELGNLINLPALEENPGFQNVLNNPCYEDFLRPINGQKWSRFFGQLCKKFEINTVTDVRTELHTDPATNEVVKRVKDYGYNYHFALLGDSINPLVIKGKTFVISINLIDYLTMAFGTNWSSCHTIDKKNKRKSEHTYEGQYCGGTLGYARDKVSMIACFVDEANENKHDLNEYHHYGPTVPYCRRDKEHRAVAAWENDKLYVARVYPDGRDGGEVGIGAQFREIIQQTFAECLDVSNIWTTKKGTHNISGYIQGYKCSIPGYPDWEHYDDCTISFLRRIDGILNEKPIVIMADARCPMCGDLHSYTDNILCEDCCEGYCGYCNYCEEGFSEEDEVYINGYDVSFCCRDCAENAGYRIDAYGDWIHLNDAVYCVDDNNFYSSESDDVAYCEDDSEYHLKENMVYCEDDDDWHLKEDCNQCEGDGKWYSPEVEGITTYDNTWFHDEAAARDNGYTYCDDDDKWHHMA